MYAMADISKELEKLRSAVYGEEVRGAFISVAEKTNEVSEATESEEKKRVSAESARVSAENTRVSQENARKQAETARAQAETGRANAEKTRVTQEETRKTAETARAGAESTRVSQETDRKSAETARANAEKSRGTAETGRVNAEQKRQTDTGNAIENCNTATDRANKAADNANKAAESIQGKIGINDKQPSDTTTYSGNKIETEFLKKNGDSSKTAVTFEVATQRANIQPQDTLEVAFGKLAKFCGDLKSHAFTAPVNNLAGTNPDLALAAPQGRELKKQVDALNSALTPVEIFVGARAINASEPWHNTLRFSDFSKIDMMISFQDGHFILPFYTYKNDNMKQSFSFSYFNQADNKGRIIAGNMVFAGRYTNNVIAVMSYGLQDFQQLDASGITVNRIIGYY